MTLSLTLLGLLWLVYFALHSLFASLWFKTRIADRWPWAMPWYRLVFNGLAILLLLPLAGMMWWLASEPLWHFEGIWRGLSLLAFLLALGGFVWSLRYYDGGEFIGTRQLKHQLRDVRDQENLHISPLHRFVRHPWYSLGLLLIWSQEMDPARLLSAVMISGYLIVGSLLEERKLMIYHGERYRLYRAKVPGLIPLPWRYLKRSEAEALLAMAQD